MKSKLIWVIVGAVLILGCALYWYESSEDRLQIEPHAAEEIEKAKRR